jgi:hypothetical protein
MHLTRFCLVSFLSVSLGLLNLVWYAGDAAVHICLPKGVSVQNNDRAGLSFRKVTSIRVPQAVAQVMIPSPNDDKRWIEAACMHADLHADVYSAPRDWRESAQTQKNFIEAEDTSTGRLQALFNDSKGDCALLMGSCMPVLMCYIGRCTVKNGLYLPRLQPPVLIPNLKEPSVQPDTSHSPRDPPWRLPQSLKTENESDTEDRVSEADRDARIA